MIRKGTLYVVGIGPGDYGQMTIEAVKALRESQVFVGYTTYIDLVKDRFPGKELIATPMRQETDRCLAAIDEARKGKTVAMICSGDCGVYGMGGLVLQLAGEDPDIEIKEIAGVTAALGGAALVGAPLGHDFAVISLSDLLTPMEAIEKRLRLAAEADFAICLYNPSSKKRADYLRRACGIIAEYRRPETVCATASNVGREGEHTVVCSLAELQTMTVDMFTTVFIGSSKTLVVDGKMVTPRGYRDV